MTHMPHSTFIPRKDWSGRTCEILFSRGEYEWCLYRENGHFDGLHRRLKLHVYLNRTFGNSCFQ